MPDYYSWPEIERQRIRLNLHVLALNRVSGLLNLRGWAIRFEKYLLGIDRRLERIVGRAERARGRYLEGLEFQADQTMDMYELCLPIPLDPGGHLKLPQLWPGQNPPPDRSGTRSAYAL
jgi:hypothetical protein